MNKKILLITAGLGVLAFIGSFAVAFLTGRAKTLPEASQQQSRAAGQEQLEAQQALSQSLPEHTGQAESLALTQKQLESLVYDVREKISEYNEKKQELELTEQRLGSAQDIINKDVQELMELKAQLASMVAALKQERDSLLKTRIEIEASERENLMGVAATYDKMNATSASQIFANMSKMDTAETRGLYDVIKIMHYMSDRTKAKVLAEMVNTEPKLAALLSSELKKVQEVQQ